MAQQLAITKQFKLAQFLNNNPQLREICKRLQLLQSQGMNNTEIESVIQQMNLPLREHLFIMGNFTNLMALKY